MKKLSFLVTSLVLALSTSAFANNEFDGDHVLCTNNSAFAEGTITAVDLKFDKQFSEVKVEIQKVFEGQKQVAVSEVTTGIVMQASMNDREFILQDTILGIDKIDVTESKNFVVLINSKTRKVSQLFCQPTH